MLVLALAALHLAGSSTLLTAWRGADRAAAPFLLPDLAPVRSALEARGIRRAYASYGPAYRLTFETGERVIVSQPWNERFLHFPLPYLDEVRFARDVAWVLMPAIPSDLPDGRAFEDALAAAGGTWQRETAGAATLYTRFEPPFSPAVEPLASAGAAGDGDPATYLNPEPDEPLRLDLPAPSALAAVTLIAAGHGPPLPRSMDLEVSADGETFERVASRRRRGERGDLRWVNGHPQYVIDNDVIPVWLAGRAVRAIRITPVASADAWSLAEVLVHPEGRAADWADWLAPDLDWSARREALDAAPRRDRADWFTRWVLVHRRRQASRNRSPVAFDRRCIPARFVAPPLRTARVRGGRRASRSGRLGALGVNTTSVPKRRLRAAEELLERVGVDRLHEVVVEAGFLCLIAVLLLTVTGESDQQPAAEAFLAQLGRDREAVHAGKADVEEDDLGTIVAGGGHRVVPVVGQTDVVPPDRQELAEGLRGIDAVVDHEDAATRLPGGDACHQWSISGAGLTATRA